MKHLSVDVPRGTAIRVFDETWIDSVWVYVRRSDGSPAARVPITWSRSGSTSTFNIFSEDSLRYWRDFDQHPLATLTDSLGRTYLTGAWRSAPPDTGIAHLDVAAVEGDSGVSIDIKFVPGWKPGLTAYRSDGGSSCDSRGHQTYAGTVDSADFQVGIGDSQGRPVVGVTPTWEAPDGRLVTKPSDENGIAFARWYIGTTAGDVPIRARLDTSLVTFGTYVRNGPLASVAIEPDSAYATPNSTIANPFKVVATDAFGNTVPRFNELNNYCFQGNTWLWGWLDLSIATVAPTADGFPDFDTIRTYSQGVARFIVYSSDWIATDTVRLIVQP